MDRLFLVFSFRLCLSDTQATEVSPRSLLIEAIRVRKNYKKSTLIKQGAFNAFYQLTDTVMGTFAYRPEHYQHPPKY